MRHEALGIFGGTFDPIHFGHLRLAEELGERLALDEVRVVPARIPPHRASPSVTTTHRVAMTSLAIAGNPRFVLDDRECRREGASYTVDTLIDLRAELGPRHRLCLLIGMDSFLTLTTWSRWQQLFELAHIAVANRPGLDLSETDMPSTLAMHVTSRLTADVEELHRRPAGCVLPCRIEGLEVSGTAIRAALQEGRSARYLLPDSVVAYIEDNHLYKELDAG